MYHGTVQSNYSSATPTPNLTYLLIYLCFMILHSLITLQQKILLFILKRTLISTNLLITKQISKIKLYLPLLKKVLGKSLIKPIDSINLFDC